MCVPTLSKIFRPVTRFTLIFYLALLIFGIDFIIANLGFYKMWSRPVVHAQPWFSSTQYRNVKETTV